MFSQHDLQLKHKWGHQLNLQTKILILTIQNIQSTHKIQIEEIRSYKHIQIPVRSYSIDSIALNFPINPQKTPQNLHLSNVNLCKCKETHTITNKSNSEQIKMQIYANVKKVWKAWLKNKNMRERPSERRLWV